MLLGLLFLGSVLALPTDEFRAIIHEGDLSMNDDTLLKQIVPSGYSPQILSEEDDDSNRMVPNVDDKDNENFKTFFGFVEKGVTEKGLIFNLYEDDMRSAAVALFRLLRETRLYNRIDYDKIKEWANINVNDDMLDYVKRLTALYSNSYISEDVFLPPFLVKPNYFVNGEAIVKALYIKNNFGKISDTVLKNYQAQKLTDNTIAVNTNYSGWNIPLNGCDAHISHFKDDVALNSYYYGVQLLHPFWMSNEELDEINPKHAEHYYFVHQQLLARYLLEKEYLKKKSAEKLASNCDSDYNPYLYYENGLAFPTRSCVLGDLDEGLTYIKSVDIAIKECIHRGLVVMENGTFIKVTPDNYINLMTKLIRANLDGIKSAKIIRSIFGYGNNGYPVNKHNPTPSALHHPQTTLRDPVYWLLIERGLDYFSDYTNHTDYDLSIYETDEIDITGAQFSKVTTIFEYAYLNLRKALENTKVKYDANVNIYARQRRLKPLPFDFNFTVESKTQKDVIVRLFLGPQCEMDSCWNYHLRFFELDCYRHKLDEGVNTVSWSPKKSNRYSTYTEGYYSHINDNIKKDYNIYKFPQNLVLPKGLEEGLNLTIFIMITEDSGQNDTYYPSTRSLYHKIYNKLDNKPLGFPFHKQIQLSNGLGSNTASNYKFFNITVFHRKDSVDESSGYFSPNLY